MQKGSGKWDECTRIHPKYCCIRAIHEVKSKESRILWPCCRGPCRVSKLLPDLSPRSRNPSAPKSPRSTFMQHYQVPSAEYSSYISHVISLGLAEDYIAQLRASCSSNSPPPLRAAIDQACRHLSGLVDDLQPVPASVHTLETLGQQNGAPVSDAAVGLAAAMPNTPEEEARILQLTQLINARHGAAKPRNTIQADLDHV